MTAVWMRVWLAFGRWPYGLYRLTAGGLSAFLAILVFLVAKERRTVALTNLRLCFPQASALQRAGWCLGHMFYYLRTFLDRSWLWQVSPQQLRKRVTFKNSEQLQSITQSDTPVIVLAPHFLGLDAAWSRLSLECDMVTMYSNQKNSVLNHVIRQGRSRFGNPILLSRQQGVRPVIQAMKQGRPLYYLPDMDFGDKDSVFVSFFGVQAATVTAVSRLARLLGAKVIPVTTLYVNGHYEVTIHPALENYPQGDDHESTQHLNHCIETWVEQNRMQYLWLHKRFKTRPPGQSRFY